MPRGKLAFALASATLGGLLLVSGCSKLQTMEKKETVSLGELAAKVAALEQQVADLQAQAAAAPSVTTPREAAGLKALVRATVLNVRQSPDRSSTKIGSLREGQEVEVLRREGDWSQIRFGNQTGWVVSQFLEMKE